MTMVKVCAKCCGKWTCWDNVEPYGPDGAYFIICNSCGKEVEGEVQ